MTKLHTTSVRFDADTWAALCADADRLGIPRAAYIREATLLRLSATGDDAPLRELRSRLDGLEARVGLLWRAVATATARRG